MNYRHSFHAGNFADVMKHALLIRLIRALQRKDKGFLLLDTHAGRGGYDLEQAAHGDSVARRPEWPDGVGRLAASGQVPPELADYAARVREYDRRQGNIGAALRFYPGSPAIARELARPQDRLVFCEKHPAECDALRTAMILAPDATVREMDGYEALRALLPPPERRALALIDPPFESQDEFAQMARAVGEALVRFATGVYALWYPLTERARVDDFFAAVRAVKPPPTLVLELQVAGGELGMKMSGCGLVVINPPWQFDREARPLLDALAGVLARGPGGAARVEWLVPEK
jgi:23S rRNA (adenine2030-N6)-methyltransferase